MAETKYNQQTLAARLRYGQPSAEAPVIIGGVAHDGLRLEAADTIEALYSALEHLVECSCARNGHDFEFRAAKERALVALSKARGE